MSFKLKALASETFTSYLSCIISFTSLIMIMCAIKFWKLHDLGIQMFPQYRWGKTIAISDLMQVFWVDAIYPYIIWLPLALLLDILIRKSRSY